MYHYTIEQFKMLLPLLCTRDTSADPHGWSPENPWWGHCAVVSLVAQELFGGTIRRGSLVEIPEFAHLRSHYWNRLPDGERDFTVAQFSGRPPSFSESEERSPDEILSKSADTRRRYEFLRRRFVDFHACAVKLLTPTLSARVDPSMYMRVVKETVRALIDRKKHGNPLSVEEQARVRLAVNAFHETDMPCAFCLREERRIPSPALDEFTLCADHLLAELGLT